MKRPLKWFVVTVVVSAFAAVAVYRLGFYTSPVAVVAAHEGRMAHNIHAPGTIQARYPITVGARVPSVITGLYADEGDRVEQGTRLARLDARELAARLTAIRADLALALANHRRDRELFEKEQSLISRSELDASAAAVEAARARESEALAILSHTDITAPAGGVITARLVEQGHTVGVGTPLFRLADPGTLWVVARVDESVSGVLAVGQPATIELRTGERATGTVARISKESDAVTRELEVNVAFDTPPERFAINLEAEVTIRAGEVEGVVVPIRALSYGEGGQAVLVIREGRVQRQPIETGIGDGEYVLVHNGIEVGAPVVAAPQRVRVGQRAEPVAEGR
ncbi:MAG: efflux RND transporter periplasmic adaptor subunit [Gammaproteobacteria bacterium]|nr:efflux RND transporter periplasmic adaptor subunit [Gammaproteobacteria bacterium]MCW8839647.1 efflux RND transporter periplasmic adaptor subunit [Gammaproteobacteria bacterium]MCW8959376.1 efflux RND transporter periplasmic adaptor subunit [Gammaproteobacteria bacterium]MCW8972385.1 efflux RND transporter periplasmic adaptor subunit [Gammaproteobacteria bacterium]MCW8992635.1 efflux RND transporter periplasmic adaptor subunit [Gammaproteobacteria bacterium]